MPVYVMSVVSINNYVFIYNAYITFEFDLELMKKLRPKKIHKASLYSSMIKIN